MFYNNSLIFKSNLQHENRQSPSLSVVTVHFRLFSFCFLTADNKKYETESKKIFLDTTDLLPNYFQTHVNQDWITVLL